jgi:hypothetical protein
MSYLSKIFKKYKQIWFNVNILKTIKKTCNKQWFNSKVITRDGHEIRISELSGYSNPDYSDLWICFLYNL